MKMIVKTVVAAAVLTYFSVCALAAPRSTPTSNELAIFTKKTDGGGFIEEGLLEQILTDRIQSALDVPKVTLGDGIRDPENNDGTIYPFIIQDENNKPLVSSSAATPAEYVTYSARWRDLLLAGPESSDDNSEKLFKPALLFGATQETVVTIDPTRFEVDVEGAPNGDGATGGVADNVYEEGHLPGDSASPTPEEATAMEELERQLNSRYELLQLRLTDRDLSTLSESSVALENFITGIRQAASTILSVSADRIVLYRIDSAADVVVGGTGLVAQFTVYPATDAELSTFSDVWKNAVTTAGTTGSKTDSIFAAAFNNNNNNNNSPSSPSPVDSTYPATVLTGNTTTPAPPGKHGDGSSGGGKVSDDDDSSSNNVVVGAVLGSLAGAAVVGGGGYFVHKRRAGKAAEQHQQHASSAADPTTFGANTGGEYSPGGMSPNALTNVDIRGSVTPPGRS